MRTAAAPGQRLLRAAILAAGLVAAACGTSGASSDAGIDAGTCGPTIASASGACFECVRAHCATTAASCDADCRCRSDFVDCAPRGDGIVGCGRLDQLHSGNTYNLFVEVESCTFSSNACSSVCGGPDAGADAATD